MTDGNFVHFCIFAVPQLLALGRMNALLMIIFIVYFMCVEGKEAAADVFFNVCLVASALLRVVRVS